MKSKIWSIGLLSILIAISSGLLIADRVGWLAWNTKPSSYAFKGRYESQEEVIILKEDSTNTIFRDIVDVDSDILRDSINLALVYSRKHCYSCLTREIGLLNEVSQWAGVNVFGVMLNRDRELMQRFNEKASISFPVLFESSSRIQRRYKNLYGVTPTVLVLDTTGKILDAHRPIPEDVRKSDSFYSKWNAIIGSVYVN